MTDFIGVSFGVLKDRVAVIATSTGFVAHCEAGMTTREVLAVLTAAHSIEDGKPVYVAYDMSVDLELALRDLNTDEKDRLFGVWRLKENRVKDCPLYDASPSAEAVEWEGVKLLYVSGKILKINRLKAKRRGLVLYDIAGYFEHIDSASAGEKYLGEPLPKIERFEMDLWKGVTLEQMIARCQREAALAARLAAKIESVVEPLDLKVRQWYGPSAIASRCLSKWQARRQARRLTERNSAHELLDAIDRAYFGGRVEAIKLGTLSNVTVFDINSAYAYAVTLLSQFARPLRFTRQFDPEHPFAVWLVDYTLPSDTVLGVLPTRAPAGSISFRLRGKGYFWQPEVEYLARWFPGCYRVQWGYVARDAKPVEFADKVRALYDYRNALKAQGDASEKIIKLALANLYGKFAQNQGTAFYQCRAWAGWITSYVRRMLLDAVTGHEDKVVCFAQDAVHFDNQVSNDLSIGEGLGEWKRKAYASGLYVAPGIYDLRDSVKGKTATRGANTELDFERIARELSDRQASEISRTFFVGWQLARMAPVKYERDYLRDTSEKLQLLPGRLRARNYLTEFNWNTESRASTINKAFGGTISARYFPSEQSSSLRLRLKDRGFA